MKNFEYAQPRTEAEAVQLLSASGKKTCVLAGGTDLVGLMKRGVEAPDRVVNIREIRTLRSIQRDADGYTWIGAAVSLENVLDDSLTHDFPSIKQIIQGISSPQLQAQGTLVGELLRRPTCWYYRDGHGLLADRGRMVVQGDNRYHAILGNRGAAKFVNASRLAPSLISLGASVRVIGPSSKSEDFIELAKLYRCPDSDEQRETVLKPGQLVTHVVLPPSKGHLAAAYEVRQGEGPDQPLASAAVCLQVDAGVVSDASVVLGQVAPTPWVAAEAERTLIGRPVNEEMAAIVGHEAVIGARPLSENEYKIQLASVAVKRAILRAIGMDTGGLEGVLSSEPELTA